MEGIDHDTLELIQNTAVEAKGAAGKLVVMHPDAEPPHIYLTVKPDGTFDKHTADPAARNHRLITLEEVERFATEKATAESIVWFDRTGIVVVLDDATRRDFATMQLNLTPTMQLMAKLEKDRPGYPQKEFRRLLRNELAECQRDARLFNWVSDLKFANMSGAVGRFSNAQESLGQDIDAQAVSGAGECPDNAVFDVRVFDDPSLVERHPINCIFEFSPQEREFRLFPSPMAVHDAIELEITFIGERLREKLGDVPCFRGRFKNS